MPSIKLWDAYDLVALVFTWNVLANLTIARLRCVRYVNPSLLSMSTCLSSVTLFPQVKVLVENAYSCFLLNRKSFMIHDSVMIVSLLAGGHMKRRVEVRR